MDWKELNNLDQLDEIIQESYNHPVVLFKHSTRCSISSVAKNRLERVESPKDITFYYLDLLAFRDISNHIATRFSVHHESPQVLLIKNGECIYDESHQGIQMSELAGQASLVH